MLTSTNHIKSITKQLSINYNLVDIRQMLLSLPIQIPANSTVTSKFLTPSSNKLQTQLHTHSIDRKFRFLQCSAVKKKKELGSDTDEIEGMPPEFYDEEWQEKQRKKTKEWHAYRQNEEDEENRKVTEYREIGMRLKGYPEEEVREARKLVSSFIRAAEEVEEKIEEAADKGELTELTLMIIKNRLDVARCDDEKEVIRSMDLLYRRVEMEILKRESSPAMRLLNDLLNLYDGFDNEGWLKKCRKRMVGTFPIEDPFSMLVPAGFDIENHQTRIGLPPEEDDENVILRVDFVREVDALLKEVREEQSKVQTPQGFDPESVADRLKQQEKQRTINLVLDLLELAVALEW